MKILITGGAGFIGSNLVEALKGHEVFVLDNFSTGKRENIPNTTIYEADICDLETIKPFFEGIDYVFHMAAMARIQPSIINPEESIRNNVMGTTNVLIAARDAGVKRVIYSASSSFYGDQETYPLTEDMRSNLKNPYSLSKYFGEELCQLFSQLYDLDTACLRYFNVYGKNQLTEGAYSTVVGIFLRQIENLEPITIVGDGEIRRDFTNVSDVVQANILAMEHKGPLKGEIFNIGKGHNYSINEIADIILKEKSGITLEYALFNGEAIHIPARPGESRITLADNNKARTILGWNPLVDFKEGIKNLC